MACLPISPGVVGGAAGDDEHLVDVAQLLPVEALLVQHDLRRRRGDPSSVSRTAAGCSWISLSMKYVVAALLGGGEVPVDVERLALGRASPSKSVMRVAVAADLDDLVLAELDRVAGELDERGDVAAEERLAVADAEHERRVAPRGDDDVRLVRRRRARA